jgi:hypothetical protein
MYVLRQDILNRLVSIGANFTHMVVVQWGHIAVVEEVVVVMVNMHSILDGYFTQLKNTGYVSNKDLIKVMLLSLINDYGHEMIECNPSYKSILQTIVGKIEGSSCLFRIGICSNELFSIDDELQPIAIPTQYI